MDRALPVLILSFIFSSSEALSQGPLTTQELWKKFGIIDDPSSTMENEMNKFSSGERYLPGGYFDKNCLPIWTAFEAKVLDIRERMIEECRSKAWADAPANEKPSSPEQTHKLAEPCLLLKLKEFKPQLEQAEEIIGRRCHKNRG